MFTQKIPLAVINVISKSQALIRVGAMARCIAHELPKQYYVPNT
jgi:hypothetical protein